MQSEPTVHATKLLMGKGQFLKELSDCIAEIENLRALTYESLIFQQWKKRVENLLIHGLGESTLQVKEFRDIVFYDFYADMNSNDDWAVETVYYNPADEFQKGLDTAKVQLLAISEDVTKHFGNIAVLETSSKLINMESKKVFIVHGHDEALLLAVEKAISVLNLEPVVLRDQPSEGMTLIQKFEKNSDGACFAVFLLTDDETAKIHRTGKEESHARQNVVFEMGYFFNAFRRKDGTHRGVFAILQEGVSKPGDVDGLVYHSYSKGNDSWKLALAKELSAAGVKFDANKIVLM